MRADKERGGVEFEPTNFLKVLAEPDQTHKNSESVDEAEVCDNGNEIDVKLLVVHEILDINANMRSHQLRINLKN